MSRIISCVSAVFIVQFAEALPDWITFYAYVGLNNEFFFLSQRSTTGKRRQEQDNLLHKAASRAGEGIPLQ